MDIKGLLGLRKKIKSRQPNFIRQDTHKKKRLEVKWRKPKGLHAKMGLSNAGHRKKTQPGYGSPKLVRNYHESGFLPVIVRNLKQLETINKKNQAIVIASTVGLRKKKDILTKAKELGILILNINEDYIKNKELALKEKRESQEKRKADKEKKAKKLEEKVKKDKKAAKEDVNEVAEDAEKTLDEKKKEEKKEQDKLLIKKQ